MKKVLLASTVLAMTATVAAAEVTLSGTARFGLDYNDGAAAGTSKTQLNTRLRFNINASTETDGGVEFGGRIRIQNDDGEANATVSPAMLFAQFEGMRLEVGNVNTAFDSAALMYDSEIGFISRSFGTPTAGYYSFNTDGYGAENNRMGVFASYSIEGFNVRVSYVDPDQTATATDEELSVSADYTTGQFTVSAAYVDNAEGVADAKATFLAGSYAVNDALSVGLQYNNEDGPGAIDVDQVTLLGSYAVGPITYAGYIADNNDAGNLTDTAFGLGASYDLGGGVSLAGDIHRNYSKDTIAGLGVSFSF